MLAQLWRLDPEITYLNHGSFGACPKIVLEAQSKIRDELEAEPVRFMARRLDERLTAAREAIAKLTGADPESLVFVRNATEGVNTILQRIDLRPGDQLLTSDHAYASCRLALDWVAEQKGAEVVVVKIPFPIEDPEQVTQAFIQGATNKTKLALVDHVTSPTGLVFPVQAIVAELQGRGVDVLVDGAHAPGMLPLEIAKLGAAYYVGNCHKWVCTPKGVAIMCVRKDRRENLRPLVISHGSNSKRATMSKYHREFDWSGTFDPSAVLALPIAIDHLAQAVPGGWPEIMRRNKSLALEGRKIILDTLNLPPPAPESMIATLAAVPLKDKKPDDPPAETSMDFVSDTLFHQHKIEVPVFVFPQYPKRLVRVSAQLYNKREDYELLAGALERLGFGSG